MITLRKSVRVIPLGIAMGVIVLVMNFVQHMWLAVPLLVLIGALSGFFVVPMNALLQHRGHILMGAGHSIAVQNFNENLSILAMTGLYFLMIRADDVDLPGDHPVRPLRQRHDVLVKLRHEANQRARRTDQAVGVADQPPHPAARRRRGHCRLRRPARPDALGLGSPPLRR
jgi:LPLT family lysophospholipid transporter-like MFS transporter